MTEHGDREAHEAKADDVERELDEMQERADRLEGEIDGASEDWERKKKDDSVPGAGGAPEQADGPEPEAEYPTKDAGGDGEEGSGEELDFGRDIDSEEVTGASAESEDDAEER
jgi:hypothetical protein